jgi:PAS domain-containing protein
MKIVCAWCQKTLSPGEPGDDVSHGICPDCMAGLLTKPQITLRDLLDRLDIAVIAVDANAAIQLANAAAERVLGWKMSDLQGTLAGNVIECVNAANPEGCGKHVNCAGCAIRGTVTATFADGQPRTGVEAMQWVLQNGRLTRVQFRISTEMARDVVLLIIEDVRPLPHSVPAAPGPTP